jgi:hypothetical protein
MYLTAHRPTVDDVDAWPGINAYLYLHGRTWQGSPPPNLPAARFERRHELIEHHRAVGSEVSWIWSVPTTRTAKNSRVPSLMSPS